MTDLPPSEIIPANLPLKKSIIVVSDLHMGGDVDRGTSKRFSNFLDTLSQVTENTIIDMRPFYPPDKIILLGDIFDMWDPLDQDRDNVTIDAIRPFLNLGKLGCELIYVTGNHDEDVGDLIQTQKKQDMLPDGIPLLKNAHLKVFKRIYPGKNKCLMVGDVRYSFPHGQQFDIQQVTNTISECLHTRFDPVDFIEDLASTSFAKNTPCPVHALIVLFALYLWYLNGNPALQQLSTAVTVAIWGIICLLLFAGFVRFWMCGRIGSRLISIAFLVPALLLLDQFLKGVPYASPALYFGSVWFISILFVTGISIPRLFVYGKRSLYRYFNPREITLKEMAIIDRRTWFFKKFRRSLRPEEMAADADVIVFGHTHWADRYAYSYFPDLPWLERWQKNFRNGREACEKDIAAYGYRPENRHPCLLRRIKNRFMILALRVVITPVSFLVQVKKILIFKKILPAQTLPSLVVPLRKYYLINSGAWDRVKDNPKRSTEDSTPGYCIRVKEFLIEILNKVKNYLIAKNILCPGENPLQSPFIKNLDTFVYIDADGMRLMEWRDQSVPDGDGKIHEMELFSKTLIHGHTRGPSTPPTGTGHP